MNKEELQQRILELAPESICIDNANYVLAIIPSNKLFEVAKQLKEQVDTQFDYLYSLTGFDKNPELGVVYHLESTSLKHKVTLHALATNRENPELDSICSLYKGAELQEREVFDFYGITFKNHPDLRRIFMDENWEGYPLRKDYVDTINIVDLIK